MPPEDEEHQEEGPAPLPVAHAGSLCYACAAHRIVRGKRSSFVMCTALAVKYPRQPVRVCPAFRAAAAPAAP